MAHLHFRRTPYHSGSGKATQRLEYITRQPERELSAYERQVRYVAREEREDLVETRSRNLPAWAEGNPYTYFRAAESYEGGGEKKPRVAFEEWKITLPHEFTHAQNSALTDNLIGAIVGDRLPCVYAFHDPPTLRGTRQQPHLHLLISARQNDVYARTAETHFKLWQRKQPERGGARKDPAFWHRGAVKAHRVMISDILNVHLEQAALIARVHPDTLERRQLDRKPEPKLLPSESRQYREHGLVSARMQEVLAIRQERAAQLAKEQVNARTYWEGRKVELGITRDQPMATKLQAITWARAQTCGHAPERPTPPQVQTHAGRVTQERTGSIRERTAPTRQHRIPPQIRAADLARQFQRLAQQLSQEDEVVGGHLNVRLRDQEQDHGMSW